MSPSKKQDARHAGVSTTAVERRTGKGWDAWFALLDRAGAARLDHSQIASLLHEKHGVAGWWSQMITVAYEQARGRRVKHETSKGFEVSASRTIPASQAKAWKLLADAKLRRRWLNANTSAWPIRTQKAPDRMRIDWGKSEVVEFRITPKAADKCLVVAQHMKLKDAKSAAAAKACWGRALEKMQSVCASGKKSNAARAAGVDG